MTNEYLKSLIDKLNKNKTYGLIHLRPLSATVDFAKVWKKKPKPTDDISYPDGPDNFYFIKNSEGLYVATVLDMDYDLHWFVQYKHRRKGHLTKAMEETILSHLFQDRDEQRISIDKNKISKKNFLSSQKIASKLGFVTVNDKYLILTKNKFQINNNINGINTNLSIERMKELKKQINYLRRSLWFIHSEVEMKLGDNDFTKEFLDLIYELKDQAELLEAVWWESKTKVIT